MQEDYVTFEQAKTLKELGFPQNTFHKGFYLLDNSKILSNWKSGDYDMPSGYYDIRDIQEDEIGKYIRCGTFTNEKFDYNNSCSFYRESYHNSQYHNVAICSLLYFVQKWLREEKNLIIELVYSANKYFCYIIYIDGDFNKISLTLYPYETYEEALSAGIDKCIEILKGN